MTETIDPVCKMELKESMADATSEDKGGKDSFCAVGGQKSFDQNPEEYLAEQKK